MEKDDKFKSRNTWEGILRVGGILTAPITGSLSKKVKEKIFGEEDMHDCLELRVNEAHWGNSVASAISIMSNYIAPFYLMNKFPEKLDLILIYAVYKGIEGIYRMTEMMLSEDDTCSGSLEGSLISKVCIEPFLKKED
jgi:hypothetical protein